MENGRKTVILPVIVPPIDLGVSWTGKTLTKYILDHATSEQKMAVLTGYDAIGPEAFKKFYTEMAARFNARVEARGHEPKPSDQESRIVVPPGVQVN